MNRCIFVLLVLALSALTGSTAYAASTTEGGLAVESVKTDDYPDTTVLVSVPRRAAQESVPADAFTLLEGDEAQEIAVEETRSADLEVLLLMDSTGSMGGEPIAAAKAAAQGFIRQLPADARLSVMSYEANAAVESRFSTNKQAHQAAIRGLTAGGETAMYDALSKALRQFRSGDEGRRAIILLTDGEDNASKLSLPGITKELAVSGTTLYVVKFSTAFTDSAALDRMANATGGRVRRAEDPQALLRVYDEIAQALVNQYALTYESAAHGAVPVTVELRHGNTSGEASTTVEFPAAPPDPVEPSPQPAVAEIESIDASSYPEIVLTILAPEQLSNRELTKSAFVLLEGGSQQELTDISRVAARKYELRYLSNGHGPQDVDLQVRFGPVSAEAQGSVELPQAPPDVFQSRTALLVGAGLCFLGMALLFLILLVAGDGRAKRGVASALGGRAAKRPSAVAGVADWATNAAEKGLSKGDRRTALNKSLEQAAINLRPGEFIVMTACIAVTALVVGRLLSGMLVGVVFAVVSVLATRAFVNFKAGRRRSKFANQLSDTLQLLAGSLRAGYSVMQAVDAVSREAESPTAEEFRRLVVETRLGRDLTEALHSMRERVGNEDFEWVVQAIGINREVGGDLAEVLDTVGHTIRERNQIRRQVKALSAEGKLSAIVLVALPFGVGFMIMLTNPSYLAVLTQSLVGWIMLGTAAVMLMIGTFWLTKIVKFRF